MDNPAIWAIIWRMKYDSDIVIVGGGLNGPALALALAGGGISSVVIDARSARGTKDARFDGRAYALSIASKRLLTAIGLWHGLAALAQPMLRIVASDGVVGQGASPLWLKFDQAEIEEGPMGFMVEDRHLGAGFEAAMAADPLIRQIAGQSVVVQEISAQGAVVQLGDGTRITARMLVGCDGRASGVAARAGIRRQGHDYGQTALVCAVRHAKDHCGTAHQFFTPGGPFAILPLAGGHHSSIVWSEPQASAAAIAALSDADFLTALSARFGDFLGEISLAGDRSSTPLSLTLAERFAGPRLALVGDAAHGVHPIAGQGLNLGLRDVGALAEVLVEASRRGEDIGAADVLERYQTWRRPEAMALALGMDGVNALFSNDNPVLRAGRDLGLGLVGAMPGLRRRFIRQAAGLSGAVPRLLAGRAL
jgi:2-octaprenyl-6-methoxyphenol hydroxylase